MKHKEIKVDGTYLAKVSGRIVPVKVLQIDERYNSFSERYHNVYYVRNLRTGRGLTFRSSQRFREEVPRGGIER